MLSLLALCYNGCYNFDIDINDKYYLEQDVIDCEFALYMYLLSDKKEEQEKRFNEYCSLFVKLSDDKKEYINKRIKSIQKKQDELNKKEKEKRL